MSGRPNAATMHSSRCCGEGWVLALDTAAPRAVAALTCGGKDADVRATAARRGEDLAEVVAALLDGRGIEVSDLSGLAVVVGPGSYTGLRVGLALVRGLALADEIPVVSLGSLELAALSCPRAEGRVACLLPAAARRAFFAVYERRADRLAVAVPAEVIGYDDLADRLGSLPELRCCCTERREAAGELRRELDRIPGLDVCELPAERAGVLAREAVRRLAAGQGRPAAAVLPVYVGTSSPRKNRNRVVLPPQGNA